MSVRLVVLSLLHTGQAKLTYFGNWELVEHIEKHELADNFYVAPGAY